MPRGWFRLVALCEGAWLCVVGMPMPVLFVMEI
jgi:hypothetical protein